MGYSLWKIKDNLEDRTKSQMVEPSAVENHSRECEP